ncbi:MAG: cache domain-containing protein [Chloroflexia bacterium]
MRKALSLNTLLLTLALLVALPIVGALGYSTYANWRSSEQAARDANTRTVEIIASQVESYVADSRFMLEQIAARPLTRSMDNTRCDPAQADFLTLHPQYTNVFTVDTSGQVVCSAISLADRSAISSDDRAWFQEVVATGRLTIGEPQASRLSGKWVAVFACPIRNDNSEIVGVAGFELDLTRFQEFLVTSKGFDNSVVRIINGEGTVVASNIDPEEWVGKNFAGNPTVRAVLSNFSGQGQTPGLDGIERLHSYTTVPSADWRVWVGVPVETVFAPARDNMLRNGAIGLLLLMAAMSVAYLAGRRIIGPINRLAQAARAAGQGKRDVRAPVEGSAEIADMAVAFNLMLAACNKVEEDLRQSEEVFKKAFQASPEALLIRRLRDNAVIAANPAFEQVTGYTRQEVFSDPNIFFEMLAGHDYGGVASRLLASGQPVVDYEVQFRHKSGEIRECMLTAEHVEIRGEQCLLVIGRDITDIRQAERVRLAAEAAEEANRAKSEFLSRMSHELRTPLNAVMGFTELMEMEDATPRQLDNLQHIRRAGQHLLKLVEEVLDIARIEAQQINLSPEPIAVEGILQECLDLIGPSAQQGEVEVGMAPRRETEEKGVARSETGEQWVLADRQKLRQTLLNLISNGIKYNRQGGSVTVGVEHNGNGYVRISVTDTGYGIPADQMDRLFVPFERLGAGRRNVEGTGLGLALCKALVEAMAGRIGVESKYGDGSTFWVELPRVVLHSTASGKPGGAWQEAGPVGDRSRVTGQVLYIEDNLSNLKLIEGVLRHRPGVRVVSSMTGAEGLEAARRSRPDLVLLDLNLPDMHGEEVLRRLREVDGVAQVPVVVVSADANPAQIEHLRSLGVHSYVTKPVDVQRLLALIDDVLE